MKIDTLNGEMTMKQLGQIIGPMGGKARHEKYSKTRTGRKKLSEWGSRGGKASAAAFAEAKKREEEERARRRTQLGHSMSVVR